MSRPAAVPERRALCALLLLGATLAHGSDAPAPVLVLRHATTDPGIGDPEGFQLDRCATQRNLSPAGRDEARAVGRRLRARGWMPRVIRSSRWCRCLDTAALIADGLDSALRPEPWPALDSFFGAAASRDAQTARLRARLATLREPGFELWVTHQVNISALTGRATAMGEGLWLAPAASGDVDARPFD